MSAPVRISIVIPTLNREGLLCDTLRAVLAQDYPHTEVIVVDQSARHEPDTERFLDGARERIRYHRHSPANLPAARNAGIRLATGDVVLFFDDDLAIPPTVVSALARGYDNPAVAGVTTFIASPHQPDEAKRASFVKYVRDPEDLRRPGLVPVDHFFGGVMSFRREIFARAGGFDEWIGTQPTAAAEDLEFCIRVRRLGFALYLDTTSTVVNVGASRAPGGCEKGTLPRDVVLASQMRCLLYAYLKNGARTGWLGGEWRALARAYHGFVLNRAIVRAGVGMLWRRHVHFARALRAASRAAGARRPAVGRPVVS